MLRELSREELETYSRQIALRDIGVSGQEKIRRARVCVIGVGGLGSAIVAQLAGMGVGLLRIVDRDLVERVNLHRQSLYDVDSLGMPKVEAAENRVRRINPDVRVEALTLSVGEHNAEKVVEDMDIVLDGLDSLAARRIVNRACVKHGKPYLFGAAVEMFGNASTIIPGETPCLDCFLPRRALPSESPGFRVEKAFRLGVTLTLRGTVEVCLLKYGSSIVRGARDRAEALQAYLEALSLFNRSAATGFNQG